METKIGAALAKKLLAVMGEISYIQKTGFNERFKYHYASEADVSQAVRDALMKSGVMAIPSVIQCEELPSLKTSGGATMRIVRVNVSVTFIDSDSGEVWSIEFPGEGMDTGDKAPYKAITGALKYALMKTFLVPTGDDPEEEREEKPTVPTSERVRERLKVTRSVGAPVNPAAPRPPRLTAAGPAISENQAKRMYAIWRGAGHEDLLVRAWMRANYGIEDSRATPKEVYDEICARLGDRTSLSEDFTQEPEPELEPVFEGAE